jgi:hypothetical protein
MAAGPDVKPECRTCDACFELIKQLPCHAVRVFAAK